MRRIAVINQKGGVGKTTSCCNIGAVIAAAGHRVLLVDLDPQANLTMHLGIEPDADKPSVYEVLTEGLPVADATVEVRENLWLLPSNIDLAAAEMELVSIMGREVILRDALRADARAFDFVFIDCPPSLGVLTINGLAAMDEVFVPMQPHFLALQGVGKLLETIRLVKERINGELRLTGIILCMYEAGTRLAGEVSADLVGFLEESRGTDAPWANARVFETIIRRNIKLAECPSHGLTITEYAPQSNGAADYTGLSAEILGVEAASLKPALERAARKPAATDTEAASDTEAAVEADDEVGAEASTAETAPPEGVEARDTAAGDMAEGESPEGEARPVESVSIEAVSVESASVEGDVIDAAAIEAEAIEAGAVPPLDAGDRTAYGPDDTDGAAEPLAAAGEDAAEVVSSEGAAEEAGPADVRAEVEVVEVELQAEAGEGGEDEIGEGTEADDREVEPATGEEREHAAEGPPAPPPARRSIPIFYEEEPSGIGHDEGYRG